MQKGFGGANKEVSMQRPPPYLAGVVEPAHQTRRATRRAASCHAPHNATFPSSSSPRESRAAPRSRSSLFPPQAAFEVGSGVSKLGAMATRMAAVLLFLLVVGAQAQTGPVTPVPGLAPFASPPFNPTGATTYISYSALSANRAPCPSGTGRSYYMPGCEAQNVSATPYQRGCFQITRCARG